MANTGGVGTANLTWTWVSKNDWRSRQLRPGAYTTWLDDESGYYFDGVLKFNRFQNEPRLKDGRIKGNYDARRRCILDGCQHQVG